MTASLHRAWGYVLPSILLIFVALYVVGVISGAEPEYALLRAGLAALLLAGLSRVAFAILANVPPPEPPEPGQQLDVTIGDEAPPAAANANTSNSAAEPIVAGQAHGGLS